MADYNAGQAYLTVLPDMSSFGEQVRRKLADENIDAKVPVKPEIDQAAKARVESEIKDLPDAEVKADITDLEEKVDTAKVKLADIRDKVVKVSVEDNEASPRLTALKGELDSLLDKTVGVNIGDAEAKDKIRELKVDLTELAIQHPDIDVRVAADAALAKLAEVEALSEFIDGKTIRENIEVSDNGSAASATNSINGLMAAGVALGPAIIPVAGAVAAALAAIGTGAVLGGATIGSIILGFHGIGGAVKDLDTVQTQQGQNASQLAAQQISSANSVASAQDGVRNAVRGVSDAERSAAIANSQAAQQVITARRAVQDAYIATGISVQNALTSQASAEQALANAQQSEQIAQENLTLARQAAQRQIESLTLSVEDGALAERQAQLNIQSAKDALDKTLANPAASELQRQQAQLTYDQSVQQLKDIQARNRNLAEDKATADAQGVEGSQQVQAAQRGVASAAQATENAQTSLAAAQRNVDEARRAGAERIAVAQENLSVAEARQAETARAGAESVTKAQEGVVTANRALVGALAQQAAQQSQTSSSAKKLADDMAKLSPAGQEFAHFVHDDLQPKVKELQTVAQQGLLPGVEAGLRAAMPVFPEVRGLVGDLSTELGSLAARAGSALNDPFWQNWIAFIRGEASPSLEIFGQWLGNLITGGAAVLQAFKPVWDQMGQGVLSWSQRFSEAAQNLRNNPDFQNFLAYIKVEGPLVVHTIGDLVDFFINLGRALAPVGHVVLEVTDGFVSFINALPPAELQAIAIGAWAIYTAVNGWKVASSAVDALRTAFEFIYGGGLAGKLEAAATNATVFATKIGASAETSAAVGTALSRTGTIVSEVGKALPILGVGVVAVTTLWNAYVTSQDDATAAMLKGGAAAAGVKAKLDDELTGFGQWANGFLHFATTSDDATAAMHRQIDAMDPLTRAQTLATQAQNDYLYAVEKWGTNSAQAVDAQNRYAAATAETTKQQDILKNGLNKTTDAMKAQQQQTLDATDAEIRWRDALQTATDGIAQNGTTLDLNTAAGRRNQTNINDLVRAMQAEEDTMKKNGATVDQVTAQHQQFHDQLVTVFLQMGQTQQQAQNLANQYMAIKDIGTIATEFLANTGAAIFAVNDMKNQINGALSAITQEQITIAFKADTGNILNNAMGGAIIGKGTGTSDSNLSWVSHGEHVWTAAEVSAAGGHSEVYKMRKAALNGYALGGPVSWQDTSTWNPIGVPDVINSNVAIVRYIADKARKAHEAQTEVAPAPGSGVERWRPVGLQGLAIAGQGSDNINRLLYQMQTESGGNNTIVNKWDSNWQKGTPSVGLMQVIGPTYSRYHHPNYNAGPFEYGVSVDPLANILASIRYTLAAYGSLASGWQGHGYDSGGILPPGITLAHNGTGLNEHVLTGSQFGDLVSAAGSSGGGGRPINISVYPRADHSEADIADMVSRRISFELRAVT